jgi:hypothetical protein
MDLFGIADFEESTNQQEKSCPVEQKMEKQSGRIGLRQSVPSE